MARLRGDAAFGSVKVNVLYAIPEKAARMDYSTGAPGRARLGIDIYTEPVKLLISD